MIAQRSEHDLYGSAHRALRMAGVAASGRFLRTLEHHRCWSEIIRTCGVAFSRRCWIGRRMRWRCGDGVSPPTRPTVQDAQIESILTQTVRRQIQFPSPAPFPTFRCGVLRLASLSGAGIRNVERASHVEALPGSSAIESPGRFLPVPSGSAREIRRGACWMVAFRAGIRRGLSDGCSGAHVTTSDDGLRTRLQEAHVTAATHSRVGVCYASCGRSG